jgi:hypothetical protein
MGLLELVQVCHRQRGMPRAFNPSCRIFSKKIEKPAQTERPATLGPMERPGPTPQEVLGELYRCCAEDCRDECRFGCIGWLHNFDPPEAAPEDDSVGEQGAGDDHLLDL